MTSRDFCYFLQGFFEIMDARIDIDNGYPLPLNNKNLTHKQVKCIRDHLNLVFYHEIDKQYEDQQKSQEIHDGTSYSEDLMGSKNDKRIKC